MGGTSTTVAMNAMSYMYYSLQRRGVNEDERWYGTTRRRLDLVEAFAGRSYITCATLSNVV